MESLALYAFAYLAAAVFAVVASHRLGLGSVVGYIAAGIIVGPVLHLADSGAGYLEAFSEFGIVMMLFLIGIEIDPQMVWRLRGKLIGLGGLQVVATVTAVAAISIILGFTWQQGVLFGFVAALSSTAIVLQTLKEKGLLESDGGRSSFAVLLFQDLAVIPMLACIPLLSQGSGATPTHDVSGLMASLPAWASTILTLATVGIVVVTGHFLSRPVFRMIAMSGLREVFTAAALLLVVGIAVLMSAVGLSPALGAFLAGVVLANSEFKHELQNDIEPFKGLLLGLFFMTIGAKVQIAILLANLPTIAAITIALVAIKFLILLPLALLFRLRSTAAWLVALALAQAGEFGFVLLAIAEQDGIITAATSSVAVLVIAFGMILTPALFMLFDRLAIVLDKRNNHVKEPERPDEGTIIVAGIGRFGQIIVRMLLANGHKPVVLDYRADAVDNLRKFGTRSFFGDAGRPDLLESAGLAKARLLVVAIDDADRTIEIVEHARRVNPRLHIIARAYDRLHHYRLARAGADDITRELFAGSIDAAGAALQSLGMHPYEVEKRKQIFAREDLRGLDKMSPLFDGVTPVTDNPDFIAGFNDIGKVITSAMLGDRSAFNEIVARGWSPPAADGGNLMSQSSVTTGSPPKPASDDASPKAG